MPYTRLFYHLVWTTKNRLPLLTPDLEPNLYNYLRLKASGLECRILAANGWEDHIHLLVEIPPRLAVSEVVKRLKGSSSHDFSELYWQRGYGALTVSERSLGAAIDYVNHQKEHHTAHTAIPRFERCDYAAEHDVSIVRDEQAVYAADPEGLF